jgi:hypothetical protein
VLHKFKTQRLQTSLKIYATYCNVDEDNDYFLVKYGAFHQCYAVGCNGSGGVLRGGSGFRACSKCEELRERRGNKITQTINKRSDKISRAIEATKRSELSDRDYHDMKNFTKTANKHFSVDGIALKESVDYEIKYYLRVQSLPTKVKEEVCSDSNGKTPCKDKFLSDFTDIYNGPEGSKFKKSLQFCLLANYCAKVKGHKNHEYGTKVINFMLALSCTSPSAFDFVSANLLSVSIRHMQRLKACRRAKPFILRDTQDMVELLTARIAQICHLCDDTSKRVAFTLGLDATVVVQGFQLLLSEGVVVGGAYPKHKLDVSDLDNDQMKKFLKECIKGKKGEKAAECKVAVVSFQNTPIGMCPYMILAGCPQTINHSNSWGGEVLKACVAAADMAQNCVLLNQSTDGVSVEVKWNYELTVDYLSGKSSQISLPCPQHNAKNHRYQNIGGSSPASIGGYVFDPYLLKLLSLKDPKCLNKVLVRIKDWALDAALLGLASPQVVEGLLTLQCADVGNVTVSTIVSSFY